MSRLSFKQADRTLKPGHLNPGQNVVTVLHAAGKKQQARDKVFLASTQTAEEKEFAAALEEEFAVVLFYREIPFKAHILNATNRNFLAAKVGDDPAALEGWVLTLERKTLPSKKFGAGETIVITDAHPPKVAKTEGEQKADAGIRKSKLAELRSLRKQEAALLEAGGRETQEPITPEQYNAWTVEEIAERIDRTRASIEFLTTRQQDSALRHDAAARLANLLQAAGELGYSPDLSNEIADMTPQEIETAIAQAAQYINLHSPAEQPALV